MKIKITLFLLMYPFIFNAHAARYQCDTADGLNIYVQNYPCGDGQKQRVIVDKNDRNSRIVTIHNARHLAAKDDGHLAALDDGHLAALDDGHLSALDGGHLTAKVNTVESQSPNRSIYPPFLLNSFEWKIVDVHDFKEIGIPGYTRRPENGLFVLIEVEVKNLGKTAKFTLANLVLTAQGRQYESSSKSVYAKEQMHYDDGQYIRVEPGITHKAYYVFDAARQRNYKLIVRGYGSEEFAEMAISL